MDAKSTAGKSATRIPSLDGLRAISIGLVLFAHCTGTRFFPGFVFARQQFGNLGVRIFFVISGYLITRLLFHEMETTGKISLKWFYIRRSLRIFPAAYAYIGTLFVLTIAGFISLGSESFLHAITYTVNYQEPRPWVVAHLWSLSVEEQFYLLWPAVLVVAGKKWGLRIAASLLIISPLFRVLPPLIDPSVSTRWYGMITFQANADALAAGCVLAGIRGWLGNKEAYLSFLRSPVFLLMPAGIMGAIVLQQFTKVPFSHPVMNICIALCVDRSVRFETDTVGRFLNWKPMMFVGMLSYSIYLWQQPFLRYGYISASPLGWFPFNLMCVVPCSLASFYLVEKPFLNLRKRLERKYVPKPKSSFAHR